MPRTKHRLCLGCSQPFTGRVDAKTCSPKCRKRFQRTKVMYRDVLLASEQQTGYNHSNYAVNENLRGHYAGR